MVEKRIKALITKFIKSITSLGIRIDKVIVYGSYVKGKAHLESDIDLAIVSPDFGKDRLKEGKILLKAAWRINPILEPIPISSKSYKNDNWIPLIYEIKHNGVEFKLP